LARNKGHSFLLGRNLCVSHLSARQFVTEGSKVVKQQLEVLEKPLSADDIMLYRRMARAKIPKKASKTMMASLSSWWSGPSEEPAVCMPV
jgi:hypothetical protein